MLIMLKWLCRIWTKFCAMRFLIVGAWDTFFSYMVFAFLYYLWGGGLGDVAVIAVSSVIGITNAFLMHRYVTYRSNGIWWKEYLRFYVVYGGQLILQSLFFFIFSTWLGYNGYIIKLINTLIFTVVSYWAHKSFSFKS